MGQNHHTLEKNWHWSDVYKNFEDEIEWPSSFYTEDKKHLSSWREVQKTSLHTTSSKLFTSK